MERVCWDRQTTFFPATSIQIGGRPRALLVISTSNQFIANPICDLGTEQERERKRGRVEMETARGTRSTDHERL